jgi:hypothetical protein
MSFFARPHYESDTTLFIHELRKQDPQLETRQREGRALLWDQKINLRQQAEEDASEVPQKPYVYQTNPVD